MKRFVPYLILMIFLAAAAGGACYWWQTGRHIESTDNAYIRGDITPIGCKISGYVEALLVADNQVVEAGQLLVRIEDREYQLRMQRGRELLLERQAALLVVKEERAQQLSGIDLNRALLEVAEIDLKRETDVCERYLPLYQEEVLSWFDYNEAKARKEMARAQQVGAQARLQMAQQQLTILLAREQQILAEIGQHRQELKLLEQEVADTCIRAPISGTVGNRRVRSGQYVRPGSTLMALIPLNEVWVEANFKEIQLARMQEGQPVDIEIDAFPDLHLTGRIQSLSPASGAEFSLLPPENASGNFTKIVQRIPVKISFDKDASHHKRLLPGMSVEVSIDTRSKPLPKRQQLARN